MSSNLNRADKACQQQRMDRRRFVGCFVTASATFAFAQVALASTTKLVIFGDSIAQGYLVPTGKGWSARVATALGATEDNRAIGASLIIRQAEAVLQLNPAGAIVCWLVGYNDMRAGTPIDSFANSLQTGLAHLVTGGARVYLGNCLRMTAAGYAQPAPWDRGSDSAVVSYNQVITQVATTSNALLIDASRAYDPARVLPDNIHPDEIGHAEIASAFLRALLPYRFYLPQITFDRNQARTKG